MYIGIYLLSVFIASLSQILLKKSAMKEYEHPIYEYLNPYVITGYLILFLSMALTIFAYQGVALKSGPVLESASYIFVAILSYIFLREKISKRTLFGLFLIVFGVVISNIN